MAVYHTENGGMVCAYPPEEGDRQVQVWMNGQPRMTFPIEEYRETVDWAISIANQYSSAIHVVPVSGPEALKFLSPRLENGLASMTDTERGQLRRRVVNSMCEVMRDCPDPSVRADAHEVLVKMKVVKP